MIFASAGPSPGTAFLRLLWSSQLVQLMISESTSSSSFEVNISLSSWERTVQLSSLRAILMRILSGNHRGSGGERMALLVTEEPLEEGGGLVGIPQERLQGLV